MPPTHAHGKRHTQTQTSQEKQTFLVKHPLSALLDSATSSSSAFAQYRVGPDKTSVVTSWWDKLRAHEGQPQLQPRGLGQHPGLAWLGWIGMLAVCVVSPCPSVKHSWPKETCSWKVHPSLLLLLNYFSPNRWDLTCLTYHSESAWDRMSHPCLSLLGKSGSLQTMFAGLKAGHAVRRLHGWGCKMVGNILSFLEALTFSHMSVSLNHLCPETIL